MQHLISKALRYGPCLIKGSQFYLPPTHEPYLPLLHSRKASPPFGRYQLILLREERHKGVKNLPRVFYAACPAESRTHDLLIASATLYTDS